MGLTVKQKMIAKSKKAEEQVRVPFGALLPSNPKGPAGNKAKNTKK
jgi:hypothetical protein